VQAFAEIGYRFDWGPAQIEPFAGASLLRLHTDSFIESGGSASLLGHGRTYDLGTTTVGLRAQASLGADTPVTLKGMLGWRHAYGDVAPELLMAFRDGSVPFAV